MTLPLLYSNNADIKYPLDMFDESQVPNDILLDLSLSLPEGITPVVGAIRITESLAFVSIEDKATRAPLATAAVASPQLAVVYPLEMAVEGFGWIVFGPGLRRDYYSSEIQADLDPETYVGLRRVAPQFSAQVNGFDHAVSNILTFLTANTTLLATRQGDTIYLDRDDTKLRPAQIADFTLLPGGNPDLTKYVLTIGGVEPDENGNIDIDIVGCFEDCIDVYSLPVPRGDTGEGEYGELPLDKFAPRTYGDGEACLPSSYAGSSLAGPVCQTIIKIDIEDGGRAIGTLYTFVP